MQANNAEMNLLVIIAPLGLKRGKFTETIYSPIADTRSFYQNFLFSLLWNMLVRLEPQKHMSKMGEAKMQLARHSAEGVTANTETEGSISDKNREW